MYNAYSRGLLEGGAMEVSGIILFQFPNNLKMLNIGGGGSSIHKGGVTTVPVVITVLSLHVYMWEAAI